MNNEIYIEYTKEQCLYALKQSIENCRIGLGKNGSVCLAIEVVLGIYNYLNDTEKLYLSK